MNREFDISLYGDNLKEWRQWIESLKQDEWLTGWAIRATDVIVLLSMPFWIVARILGIPLMILDPLTGRLFGFPFRLATSTIMNLILWSSDLWTHSPASRPVLLVIQPVMIASSMFLINLAPEYPDYRMTQSILTELWPLSRRRLHWIEERGTGKEERLAQLRTISDREAE